MLQIISGRFFGGGTVVDREQDAILYSNLSWPCPIAAPVMEMRPADLLGRGVSPYVLRFTNRYERLPGDVLYLADPNQAVDQFRMLCCIWFRAYFHGDRSLVEHLCREHSRGSQDTHVPRGFMPRVFDPGLHCTPPEAEAFPVFVEKVLRMPRAKYRRLMSCLEVYLDSLEALGTNFDLAYTMMAYALEALGQGEDGYTPVWDDYDEKVRSALDQELGQVDPDRAEAIRRALLDAGHLKLSKRFIAFTAGHVSEGFFTTEPSGSGVVRAMPRSRLERALRNLYTSRSGFVHQLRKVRDQLGHPRIWTDADYFEWDHEPYFTFAGLVRLVRHVLLAFVERQPKSDREEYPNWRDELPGIMQMKSAPRYWIWQVEGFTPAQARPWLNGFFDHLAGLLTEQPKAMPDLGALMERIESLAPQSRREDRRAMVTLYWFYHALCPPEGRRPDHEAILSRYECDVDECRADTLAACAYLGVQPPWSAAECAEVYDAYERSRFAKTSVHLPIVFEVASMAAVANLHLAGGDAGPFARWIDRAILDASGATAMQETLRGAREEGRPVDIARLFGHEPPSAAEQAEGPRGQDGVS
jgi:hypothetical protein